jgi:hypothetical protein
MSGKALWPLSIPHNSYVLLMRAGALRKRPEVVSLIAETACYNDCLKFHTEVSMLGIMTGCTPVLAVHISQHQCMRKCE